jgi:RNA polymerase sigma-70 factor (ECF subfamily)
MDRTESLIIEQLRLGNEEAYRYLYDKHYPVLCHVACQYVHDDFLSETIAGDVIFHIWEIRADLNIRTTIRSYLVSCVRNRCKDYLKSQYHLREVRIPEDSSVSVPGTNYLEDDDYPLGRLLERELEERIRQAIDRLPSQCRQVFKMSRFEGKHNPEIAEQLGISINTVKYHLRYALSFLRKDLQKYLLLIILFFFNH